MFDNIKRYLFKKRKAKLIAFLKSKKWYIINVEKIARYVVDDDKNWGKLRTEGYTFQVTIAKVEKVAKYRTYMLYIFDDKILDVFNGERNPLISYIILNKETWRLI